MNLIPSVAAHFYSSLRPFRRPRRPRPEALADAVRSARQQAEILTKAAGVHLGPLQSIDHTWSEIRFSHSDVAYSMPEAQEAPLAHVDPENIGTLDTATPVWEIKAAPTG